MEGPSDPQTHSGLSSILNNSVQRGLTIKVSFNNVCKTAFSWPARISRAAVARYLIAQLCLCVFAQAGNAASGALEASAAPAGLLSSRTGPQFIVIGFLGGFVSHDEPHHPEVHLMQTLRQQYPKDVYFGLFENNKIEEAYELILDRLDVNRDGTLSNDEKRQACIELFGHSWGAAAVIALSRKLERRGVPVQLTVQLDRVRKPFHNDRVIPANVLQAANFYQTRGLIHGQSKIVAADPSLTTILGHFRWEYKQEPVECRDFSWHARLFTKAHIEIECDPRVWAQVETLLRGQLRHLSANQTGSADVASSRSTEDAVSSNKDTQLLTTNPVLGAKP